MKYVWIFLINLMVFAPKVTLAQESVPGGLVPCGDDGQLPCETCHVYQLVDNVFTWIFGAAAAVAAIIIVVGGMRMVTAGGNQMAKRDARKWIGTAAVGFILIMSAWIIVELLIATLYGVSSDDSGIWSSIRCSDE